MNPGEYELILSGVTAILKKEEYDGTERKLIVEWLTKD